jgi:hypothetical protein
VVIAGMDTALVLNCCYTVVTLLLLCCHTVVTLLLHCCYTAVIAGISTALASYNISSVMGGGGKTV